MTYVDRTLAPGEKVIARGRFHWTYTLASWMWLLLAGWLLVGIYFLFIRQVQKWTT